MLDKQDIEVIKELLQPINDKLKELQTGQDEHTTLLNKHTIILENMDKKLNTVIEGQQAQAEQNSRQFEKLEKNITDKIDVTQLAVKDTSKDVKDLKKTAEKLKVEYEEVKGVTKQNSYDVQSLRNGYKRTSQG